MRLLRVLPLLLAAAAWLLALLVTLSRDERARREAFDDFSIHATSPAGASLAWSYLSARRESGQERPVRALTSPLSVARVPSGGVILRLAPGSDRVGAFLRSMKERTEAPRRKDKKERKDVQDDAEPESGDAEPESGDAEPESDGDEASPSPPPSRLLEPEEDDWVRAGGRLVVALDQTWRNVDVRPAGADARPAKVHPAWPAVRRVDPLDRRVLAGRDLASGHALFALGDAPTVLRLPRGRGEVILLSCPEALSNAHLGEADHLLLLETLVGDRPAWFDETIHGSSSAPGVLHLMRDVGLGPFLVLSALACALSAWRLGTRVGPPSDANRETRSEAVDLVASLARLYERALTGGDLLALHRENLAREVAATSRLRDEELEARLLALGAPALSPDARNKDIDRSRFNQALSSLNEAFRRQHRGRA